MKGTVEFRRSPDEDTVPGGRLIEALWTEMNERGETSRAVADHLDITYDFWMKLTRGDRPVPALQRDQIERAAAYLKIPTSQAFLMAEILRPEDFAHQSMSEKIAAGYRRLAKDPVWCGYSPSLEDWESAPESVRLLACLLHERAAQTDFFKDTETDLASAAPARLA